jgi:D-sedoheptulose 7-phosphate isomerase
LLTCFSNDFGYEKWVEKTIEFYADEGDAVILISAGGNSPNMINGVKSAKKKKIRKIITLTGNDENNSLKKLGDINLWVNSKAYNHVENVHQALLLSLVDLIIGKTEYPPN